MIASAFGISSAYRYVFPTLQASDEVVVARPAIVQQVGGASGAFDYYGAYRFPLAPTTYIKKFTLSAASYAAVETALQNLQQYTVADYYQGSQMYLYGTQRGGTAHAFYTPAKCISLKAPETYGRNYTTLPVELQFHLAAPWWYGVSGSTSRTANGLFTITNNGNMLIPIYYTVYAVTGTQPITYVSVSNSTTSQSVVYSKAGGLASSLTIDTATYTALDGTTPCYDYLAFGTTQVSWLELAPGLNSINLTVTKADGTWQADFSWVERWSL